MRGKMAKRLRRRDLVKKVRAEVAFLSRQGLFQRAALQASAAVGVHLIEMCGAGSVKMRGDALGRRQHLVAVLPGFCSRGAGE